MTHRKPETSLPKERTLRLSDLDPRVLELLGDHCDFIPGVEPSGLAMLPSTDELELIAGDGSGGCFYLWHSQEQEGRVPVVYLSSYGETSRFADDFTDALAIVTGFIGYWSDLLVAVHKNDRLVEQVIQRSEEELDEEYVEARTELRDLLGLDLENVRERFIAAVRRTPPFSPLLISEDGFSPAESFASRPYPE